MSTKEKTTVDNKTIMDCYFQTTPAYTARTEMFEEKEYIVVPVVMMVEGVHSGSMGPILHQSTELGRFPASWDGIPVTLGHPQVDGHFVSAASPEILKNWAIGLVFNTHMDGDSLKAEAWIEVNKLTNLSPETLERIRKGEVIEVSVGVYSDYEVVTGTYGEEQYEAIAMNHRPNHLALLPDEVGACSIEDGCGLRVNKKGGETMKVLVNEKNQDQIFKELSQKGFSVNETGFQERASKAQAMLNNKDTENSYYYLEELYESEMVYVVHSRDEEGGRNRKYYKQTYQENAAGEIELTGEAVQVKRVIDYPTVPSVNKDGKVKRVRKYAINSKKEDINMSEKCSPCVEKAVNALIANKESKFDENDREWLEQLDETQLSKLAPIKEEVVVNKEVTKEKAVEVLKGLTVEEYMSTLPETIREHVQEGLNVNTKRRASMVETIVANESSPWSKEELEEMKTSMLEKVYKTITKEEPVDYSAFGSKGSSTEMSETPKGPVLRPLRVDTVKS